VSYVALLTADSHFASYILVREIQFSFAIRRITTTAYNRHVIVYFVLLRIQVADRTVYNRVVGGRLYRDPSV